MSTRFFLQHIIKMETKNQNDKKENKNKYIVNIAKYSSLGIEFGSIVMLTSFLGLFLDKKFYTSPTLTIIGIFLGFTLGVYRLYLIVKGINKK